MTNNEARFEHLSEFLADTEGMPLETVMAELQAEGVNVAQCVADVKALTAEPNRDGGVLQFAGNLARRSKEELMKILEELESGPFSAAAGSPLSVAARARELSRMSETELRERIGKLQDNRSAGDSNQPSDS
jgi:exonuclease VII small subunit